MKKSKVTRLPVQHPKAPHCPECERPLPNLDGLSLDLMSFPKELEVLAVTLLIRCICGAAWNLTKKAK